jgi:hypothetical protein
MDKRTDTRRTVPTKVAAIAVGVTPATIRKWASRGKIKRYGRPGRPEYSIEELLCIAMARNESATRGQRSPAGDDEGKSTPD